ncbi:DUF3459 domain-containing protein [Robertkochia marina]|uniref:DUF3459 domain-containing protein n=1 Tax=Robertkochia marina TaxID=1227945 RepID=A0A4S3M0B1_9FLAO|nr:alpha-amylase family glycosyl hydrolase [Robertkochia marina]THD67393.1 DUF3459 domain-containing protein [Robertkochia marina]TRZ43047.1 DUF3459 domain-containing protein [Robertkochia marina]
MMTLNTYKYFYPYKAFTLRALLRLILFAFPVFTGGNPLLAQTNESLPWWKSASIYQVYPRSFMDSDNDGIGDIDGIISKLDYIKNLGFEAIWFSPFFKSPQQDIGYDISDYKKVDPEYGKEGDLERLIDEVHKRDMKVIFDLVLNHTSIEHPWFQESLDSTSQKADWYVWQKGKGKKAPNNWKNIIGIKGWQYAEEKDQWYYTSFLPFQADLNWRNPEVVEAMFNMVRYWLDRGVDGFRLDIFNVILEDAEFRDNPKGLNPLPRPENPAGGFQNLEHNLNHPENYQVAKELRKVLDEYEDRFLIGEVMGEHQKIKGFLSQGKGLHSIFLFDLIYFDFSAKFFKEIIKEFENHYPEPLVPVYVFSNHDVRRSIGRVDNDHEKAKLLALFQLTARGIPVVYQGEEFGSSDLRIHKKEALDPLVDYINLPQFVLDRLPFLINRDECRTPMQWSSDPQGGFTEADTTWLPVNPEYKTVNASRAVYNKNSLLHTYRDLLHLRAENEVLKYGSARILEDSAIPKNVYGLEREYNGQKVWVLINFGKKTQTLENQGELKRVLFAHKGSVNDQNIVLPPFSGIILK